MISGSQDENTDRSLIERWKSGDSRAATELVTRHADALARFAVSSGERREVEELVQDTFVRAFASIDSFRGESSLRTWLFTIERRLILPPVALPSGLQIQKRFRQHDSMAVTRFQRWTRRSKQ